ncbi:hypothetical protein CDAR_198711 [Caerostris darwini]|uniref:Uncharacterized protein n=1 Tax=Caerostris darwini TaxID=1538125 RepID=A0AAV4W5S1_9ARAC|nr:hypothetical protein CDAR_198711 [Caerostris darwini]
MRDINKNKEEQIFNYEHLLLPRNPTQSLDRTFCSNGYNLARERNRSGRKVNKTEKHAIVLRRHFLGEDPFLLLILGNIHYAGATSGDITTREHHLLPSGCCDNEE